MPIPAGTRIGSYAIERLLGAGGMGEVYLAHDDRLGREVALKILPSDVAAGHDRRARFEREARMAAALKHAHICTIYEVGEASGQLFIAMEYVEGTTLRDRVRVDSFSLTEALDIAIQIADALDEARQKKVVHRDLKSANILLTPRGEVKILDFGLAKRVEEARPPEATTEAGVTDAGIVIGTAAYMSPEQALGQPVDHRSDLFSFGVVLYELLTGRLPFTGKTSMELFSAILHSAPPPIPRFNDQVPDPLVRVVGKLLEKDREQRYQSARDVLNDLRKVRDEGGAASRVAVPVRSHWRRVRLSIAVGLLVVSIGVSGLWWLWQHGRGDAAPTTLVVMPAQVHGAPLAPYLTDAFAQTTSSDLAQVIGLDVKPPPTSMELERLQGDVKRAVGAYDVQYYVQPIVYADAGQLKVTVQIVDRAADRLMPGSLEYEGTQDTYLTLIHHAAEGVRAAIRPSATPVTAPAGQTRRSDAELALQEGRHFSNRYNYQHEPPDFDLAKASFERALTLDPRLAEAAAHLAQLYVFRSEMTGNIREVVDQVESYAHQATTIDPLNGIAWAVTARAADFRESLKPQYDWRAVYPRSLRLSLKAATLAPNDALVATTAGFWADSFIFKLAAVRESERLDPLYPYATAGVGYELVALNRSAEAHQHLTAVLDRDPSAALALRAERIEVLADLGRIDEAQAVLQELRRDIQMGKWPKDVSAVPELEVLAARHDPGFDAAFKAYVGSVPGTLEPLLAVLARYGKTEAAMQYLEKTADPGYANFDFLAADPRIDALRSDPRFAKHLTRSRMMFVELVAVLDQIKADGQFPKHFDEPLRQMHALLDSHPATPSR
jgi:tetratricopeptide (TPR) repeat protein/predicted Ser/Thr protein kinase